MAFAIINMVAFQEYQEYNKLPNCISGTTQRLLGLEIQVDDYHKSDRTKCACVCVCVCVCVYLLLWLHEFKYSLTHRYETYYSPSLLHRKIS